MTTAKKYIYWTVTLIGVGCIGVGASAVVGYFTGKHHLTRWIGDVPMAFSTSLIVTFVGIALYLIGKHHVHEDH